MADRKRQIKPPMLRKRFAFESELFKRSAGPLCSTTHSDVVVPTASTPPADRVKVQMTSSPADRGKAPMTSPPTDHEKATMTSPPTDHGKATMTSPPADLGKPRMTARSADLEKALMNSPPADLGKASDNSLSVALSHDFLHSLLATSNFPVNSSGGETFSEEEVDDLDSLCYSAMLDKYAECKAQMESFPKDLMFLEDKVKGYKQLMSKKKISAEDIVNWGAITSELKNLEIENQKMPGVLNSLVSLLNDQDVLYVSTNQQAMLVVELSQQYMWTKVVQILPSPEADEVRITLEMAGIEVEFSKVAFDRNQNGLRFLLQIQMLHSKGLMDLLI